MIELVVYVVILVWGIGTTIYGLWLSHQNNKLYNEKIVQLLEEIRDGINKL